MQGSGSIFRKDHRKISTLSHLHREILAVLDCRQADVPKTRNSDNRLARAIVPPKPPVLPFVIFALLPYESTQCGGFPKTPSLHQPP